VTISQKRFNNVKFGLTPVEYRDYPY